jgi:predicted Zn-dependent protease
MVETMRQDYRKAQTLYADAVAKNPDFMLGWLGLAATSSALDDTTQCARAAVQIQRLEPHHPKLAEIERYLSRSRQQG